MKKVYLLKTKFSKREWRFFIINKYLNYINNKF